jgi:hypothetical protein
MRPRASARFSYPNKWFSPYFNVLMKLSAWALSYGVARAAQDDPDSMRLEQVGIGL